MPIYAYRCATCGHAQDVLQRMSDPLLTVCPSCAAATFEKQLTAAGFQLKGSGWYVTDFRNGNTGAAAKKDDEGKDAAAETGDKADKADKPDKADRAETGDKPAAAPAAGGSASGDAAATSKPSPAAAPAAAAVAGKAAKPATAPAPAAPPASGAGS